MRQVMAIALLIAATSPADAADSFFAAYIGGRGGAPPCYARTYDAKHLAAHPKQKVVHFFVTRSDIDNLTPPDSFDLAFGFRLRDSTDSYASEAGCVAKGEGAVCLAEGDGGQFHLSPRPDGLLVTVVEFLALEGMESFSPNLAESDDREFRLYTAPASECFYDWGGDNAEGGATVLEPLTPSISRPD